MSSPSRPRQFVLIMTDTQRRDMLGCYGNDRIQTPNLDRLARDGIRFSTAYTCQPVCGPARAALFTGVYPHNNNGWANSHAISADCKSIGRRLSDAGIHCGYVGKWHLDGHDYFGNGQCPGGWDPEYWYDMKMYLDELPEGLRPRTRSVKLNQDPALTAEMTFANRCSDRALRFLQEKRDESFLLVVSYDEPHHPFVCPKPYCGSHTGEELPEYPNWQDSLKSKPALQRHWAADAPRKRPAYLSDFLDCNAFVDHEIGRVLQGIDSCCPDATVLYTTDHGDMLTAHGLSGKGPAMYDEISRIPFILRSPEITDGPGVYDHPVSHIDVVPTILDYFQQARPPILPGRSLLPILSEADRIVNEHVFFEWTRFEANHNHFGGFFPIRGVTDGHCKLNINLFDTDELYDLSADPDELCNLIDAAEYKDIRNRLHDVLLAQMETTIDPFRGYQWRARPWRPDAPGMSYGPVQTHPTPADPAYQPAYLSYNTGLPPTGQ